MEKNIYQFKVNRINGEEISLDRYKGKVLLIVNTASECGFTPQLRELQSLYKEFDANTFEILSFPSNDFGNQEPLDGDQILKFCSRNYEITFPVFDKIRVRGPYAHPLYKFLCDKKLNGQLSSTPRWNFHKFLVNAHGEVVDYFFPFTKPNSSRITKKIAKLVAQATTHK